MSEERMRTTELSVILERLRRAYDPERIYLFGSAARDDRGPESDYDVLIVVADGAPRARKRSRLAYDALWGTGVAADVVVCTHTWFEERRHLKASLPGTVVREGRLLYSG